MSMREVKKRILPLEEPYYKTNPFFTNRLAIMLPKINVEEWLLDEICNFWINKNYDERGDYWGDLLYSSEYRFCPYIVKTAIPHVLIQSKWKNNILELIMDIIDSEGYAYLNVNMSYIKKYNMPKEANLIHDALVYGYDTEEQIVYMADFFHGIYQLAEISFEEFVEGFEKVSLSHQEDFLGGVNILYLQETDVPYKFNLKKCANGLLDFLNSDNTQIHSILNELDNKDMVYYGISCYDGFVEYFEQEQKDIESIVELEYRPIHYFYVSKELMRRRFEFLVKEHILEPDEELLEMFKSIEHKWLQLRNLIFIYNKGRRPVFFERAYKILQETKQMDKEAVTILYQKIQKVI